MTAATQTIILLVISILLIADIYAQGTDTNNITVVNPDRSFGYTIGDKLEQRFVLAVSDEEDIFTDIPLTQREGRWVTRQEVSLDSTQRTLLLRYQIINSPPTTRAISLPPLVLHTRQGKQFDIPQWRFSVAPLAPVETGDNGASLPAIQADWSSTPATNFGDNYWRNIKLLIAALALCLLTWALWLYVRARLELRSLPFARAYHLIRSGKSAMPADCAKSDNETAWLALHRAFDQQCGRAVDKSSVKSLLRSTDWLGTFESDINTFFNYSSKRFYSSSTSDIDFDIEDFAKRLHNAERRNTSDLGSTVTVISFDK